MIDFGAIFDKMKEKKLKTLHLREEANGKTMMIDAWIINETEFIVKCNEKEVFKKEAKKSSKDK
jgi:hypothetical protein